MIDDQGSDIRIIKAGPAAKQPWIVRTMDNRGRVHVTRHLTIEHALEDAARQAAHTSKPYNVARDAAHDVLIEQHKKWLIIIKLETL